MITYLEGDATDPQGPPGNKIIAHVCNDVGAWGRGFVLALSKRWPEPEKAYRDWYKSNMKMISTELEIQQRGCGFNLGDVQFVQVSYTGDPPDWKRTWVVNMIAQRGITSKNPIPIPPIRYEALESCLQKVAPRARIENATIHMPRIGCGLAGGEWSKIEPILERTLDEIEVFVYDYNTNESKSE